jgi:hypothetical protein
LLAEDWVALESSQMPEDNHIEKVSHPDRVGKVFIVLTRSTRLCLICEGAFTSQGAGKHSGTICHPPEMGSADGGKK